MVPNARFNELLKDIEPSTTTKTQASSAHNAVREHLRYHTDFKKRWVSDFLAGSYARDTAIRPRTTEDGVERPDVDIIVVTNFSTSDDPDDVLQELADALSDEFEVERINKRSVRVLTSNAEIDVVPVVNSGSYYQLPCRELGRWKMTNPPAHNEWSKQRNTDFDGRFKPLVKLFKWWKRENPAGKRPKGFALEVLASKHAPKDEKHYGEAFAKMLESIYATYGALADAGIKPSLEDPAILGNDILSKCSITDWKTFMERVRVHAGIARRAQETDDMEEATKLWRRVFGSRFKSTDTSAQAASLTTAAVAPAAGRDQYSFPNTPAAPTRPRGFA